MGRSPLELIIDLDGTETSDDRREVMRLVTDPFMVAADRYSRRDLTHFDILLSRTGIGLDRRLRRLIAMTLLRAGATSDTLRHALADVPPQVTRFLRRSAIKPLPDLLHTLREQSDLVAQRGDQLGDVNDGHSLGLPSAFAKAMLLYTLDGYLQALEPRIGRPNIQLILRTVHKVEDVLCKESQDAARDEIVAAKRTVREWSKRLMISDTILAELIEARAMTEAIFALMERFEFDCATTLRVLNDSTFESLAISCRSTAIRRSVFAKILFGFRSRITDKSQAERILNLYERLDQEAAQRIVRFWRLRVADVGGALAPADPVVFSGERALA